MNQVKDGPACSGCGLLNYEGLCPHCRGNEAEFNEMWSAPTQGILTGHGPSCPCRDCHLEAEAEDATWD